MSLPLVFPLCMWGGLGECGLCHGSTSFQVASSMPSPYSVVGYILVLQKAAWQGKPGSEAAWTCSCGLCAWGLAQNSPFRLEPGSQVLLGEILSDFWNLLPPHYVTSCFGHLGARVMGV